MIVGLEDLVRLLAACLAGGLIGFERELHDKPAGLRTNILICLGAALFTLLSIRVPETYLAGRAADAVTRASDPTRIAAQIVTGVGFLGAGSILQSRGGMIIGLTTAATIWMVASIGMAFGAGQYLMGATATLVAGGVLLGLQWVEATIALWRTTVRLHIKTDTHEAAIEFVEQTIRESGLRCTEKLLQKTFEGFAFDLELVGPEDRIEGLQRRLMLGAQVRSVKRN